MLTTPIAKIMTRHVNCSEIRDSLADVLRLMSKTRNSCVIIREGKKPMGIVTEHDLVQCLGNISDGQTLKNIPVGDIMHQSYKTISEEDTLHDVLQLAIDEHIKHFPIVNDLGELEGLVTQTDLIEYYSQTQFDDALAEENEAIRKQNKALQELALEDPMLGIGNRRAMEQDLERMHDSFLRNGTEYIIALFDVDYFKKYNDHFGHLAGDEALRKVAESLKSSLRKYDKIFRYGGEELLVLLQHTSLGNACIVTERMCKNVEKINLEHPESPFGKATISAGLVACDESKQEVLDWRQIVSEADDFLYEAKENGRNCVESALHRDHSVAQAVNNNLK